MKTKFQWNNHIPINMMPKSIILVWLSGDNNSFKKSYNINYKFIVSFT